MTRRFLALVNPKAAGGRSRETARTAVETLTGAGATVRVVETTSLDHAAAEARAAAGGGGGEVCLAIGGDGLVGHLAGVLRGGTGELAIIPGGRGNDFARVVGIPFDPRRAALVAADGEVREVDVALANGRPFVGIVSLGFDSECNRIANEVRLIRGNLVYVYAALRALAGWRHARFDVTVDGAAESIEGFSVAVANSKAFGGGMYLAPHAELDDGRLEVVMISSQSKWAYLRGLPKVFKGSHIDEPAVHLRAGAVIDIDADRPFTAYADGDPIASTPLTITVEPRSLRLIAPAAA
ncbi:MAG: diacylglycerol kinase family lipid kinase [Thermoleophilaceae bacterium]|nr:diacylglycerol kinase family lipid kinase [Thermoleophilaceae bacterium]